MLEALRRNAVYCSRTLFVTHLLNNLCWKNSKCTSWQYCCPTYGLDFPTSSTVTDMRGAADGRQPVATDPPCGTRASNKKWWLLAICDESRNVGTRKLQNLDTFEFLSFHRNMSAKQFYVNSSRWYSKKKHRLFAPGHSSTAVLCKC